MALRFVFLSILISMVGTASLAQTDTDKADYSFPKNFQGIGDVAPDAVTAEFVATGTVLEKGDVFLTFQLKHTRTGILKNDLVFKDSMNVLKSKENVPAGTPMYANSYSFSELGIVAHTAWCAVRPEAEKPLCMFWKGKPRKVLWPKDKDAPQIVAKYIKGKSSESQYYVPALNYSSTYEGSMPDIEEKPVDFEQDLPVTVSFRKFKKDKVRLEVFLLDDDKKIKYLGLEDKLKHLKLDANGETTFDLLGKTVKLVKVGKKEVRFELVGP